MSKKDKVIEIVKKLLERTEANGCTADEAKVAITQAHKLLAEAGMSMDELSTEDTEVAELVLDSDTKGVSLAQTKLAVALAKHFGVELFFRKRSTTDLVVVGETFKRKIFAETYQFAYNTFKKSWNKYHKSLTSVSTSDKNALRNDYLIGFADGLTNELVKQENEFALVVVKSEEVVKYMESLNLKQGKARQFSRKFDHGAMSQGYSDGAFAQRNKHHVVENV